MRSDYIKCSNCATEFVNRLPTKKPLKLFLMLVLNPYRSESLAPKQLFYSKSAEGCRPSGYGFRSYLGHFHSHKLHQCSFLTNYLLIKQGLKANMKRMYQLITEQQFLRSHKQEKYKKLLFALCFFHSVLLERKKFLNLGWNIMYGFNDSDFEVGLY